MTARLTSLKVAGFRSLHDVTLTPGNVCVLIGPNGAGKSNLLWALEMVRLLAFEGLQLFVSERGGATFLLHYGPKETAFIDLRLEFENDGGQNAYEARLGYAADESLVFLLERAGHRKNAAGEWRWSDLGSGQRESRLREAQERGDLTAKTVRWLLRQINFYHFHDTSRRSALRTRAYADDAGTYLRSDGSNLPSFLLTLKESGNPSDAAAFKRIEGTLRRIAPFVTALQPAEERSAIRLDWRDERGAIFGPAHMSDGTLRALALLAALLQPGEKLPLVTCIDEPELGLHPAAVDILCEIIRTVSQTRQVIVSTQSTQVLDAFSAADVVVAERQAGRTTVRQLDETALSAWLDEYELSDLYEKNILGGRP